MKRAATIFFLFALLSVLGVHTQLSSATRGIKVTVKTPQGKNIDLYRDSYALVVGNGSYKKGWDPLPGAIRDAQDVAAALRGNGFEVTLKIDLTREAFNRALGELVRKHGRDSDNRLLFYYAGHGYTERMATDEELGYLVMVDAPAPEKDPIGFSLASVDMQTLVTQAKMIQSKHVLFIFDSCFSGTVLNLRDRVTPSAISDKVRYPVRQFITAGRSNEPVPDRSVFKEAFLDILEGRDQEPIPDGYLTGEELGLYMKNKVPEYSPMQHPQYGKIRDPRLDKGDFVFILARKGSAKAEKSIDIGKKATLPDEHIGNTSKAISSKLIQDGPQMLNDNKIRELNELFSELVREDRLDINIQVLEAFMYLKSWVLNKSKKEKAKWKALYDAIIYSGNSEATPMLLRVLKDDEAWIKSYAVHILGEIGDKRALGDLKQLKENHENKKVQKYAAKAYELILSRSSSSFPSNLDDLPKALEKKPLAAIKPMNISLLVEDQRVSNERNRATIPVRRTGVDNFGSAYSHVKLNKKPTDVLYEALEKEFMKYGHKVFSASGNTGGPILHIVLKRFSLETREYWGPGQALATINAHVTVLNSQDESALYTKSVEGTSTESVLSSSLCLVNFRLLLDRALEQFIENFFGDSGLFKALKAHELAKQANEHKT